MSKQQMEYLIEKIKQLKIVANTQPDHEPQSTYTARYGLYSKAKTDLEEVYMQFRKSIINNAFFVIAQGQDHKQFAEIAEKDFGCFTLDVTDFLKLITDPVDKSNYIGRQFNQQAADCVNNELDILARNIGILGLVSLTDHPSLAGAIQNQEDFMEKTAKAIHLDIGSELIGMYAVDMVAQKAINHDKASAVYPIVINMEKALFANNLVEHLPNLGLPTFVVTANSDDENLNSKAAAKLEKTDEASIKKAFAVIKKALK